MGVAAMAANMALPTSVAMQLLLAWAVFTLIAIAAMVVTVTRSTSTTQGQGLAAVALLLAATPIRL
jgi:hypothetical protein